jgi:hypothetical protein
MTDGSALVFPAVGDFGKYASAMMSSASNTLPTQTK